MQLFKLTARPDVFCHTLWGRLDSAGVDKLDMIVDNRNMFLKDYGVMHGIVPAHGVFPDEDLLGIEAVRCSCAEFYRCRDGHVMICSNRYGTAVPRGVDTVVPCLYSMDRYTSLMWAQTWPELKKRLKKSTGVDIGEQREYNPRCSTWQQAVDCGCTTCRRRKSTYRRT